LCSNHGRLDVVSLFFYFFKGDRLLLEEENAVSLGTSPEDGISHTLSDYSRKKKPKVFG
jgi:hypothetical protein